MEAGKKLEECSVAKCPFTRIVGIVTSWSERTGATTLLQILALDSSSWSTWIFSTAGALLAIPVGIKRKSLAPLVFLGTTGIMLDILMGINACEREFAERQKKLLESQSSESHHLGDADENKVE